MNLDKLDLKILRENFDDEMITKIDDENVSKIMVYLEKNGIYYAKDLFLLSLDLFLLPYSEFVNKFEKLKQKLGNNYINKLSEDVSVMEMMFD